MQTANVLKIGVWITIAVVILIFGTKYFQGVSLRGSYKIIAEFDRVDGLIAGNMAQTRGVRIGQVRDIEIDAKSGFVLVHIAINEGVEIREGATAGLAGFAALGDVRVEIDPGPVGNPPLPSGSRIPTSTAGDLIGNLTTRADTVLSKVETILQSVGESTEGVDQQLNDPSSDLRSTLEALRKLSEALAEVVTKESDNLSRMIQSLESASANVASLTSSDSSSAATSLTESLERMNQTLASTRSLTDNLDALIGRMNAGEGTLGKLATDEALYLHMDSAAVSLNRLLEDVRSNPKRYLGELKLIDFF